MLTASFENEDLLFVLDSRTEQIMVYRVDNMQSVTLRDRQSLPALFAAARTRSQGRGNP